MGPHPGVKVQHFEILKLPIFAKTINFLYKHMHLKVVGTNGKDYFWQSFKVMGSKVKGHRHLVSTKTAIFSKTINFLYSICI